VSTLPTLETAIHLKATRPDSDVEGVLALAEVVGAVMTLHRSEYGCCSACGDVMLVPWPCDTVKVVAAGLGLKEGDWR
jgi:hypothetical protein